MRLSSFPTQSRTSDVSRTSVEFYATTDEQRAWLSKLAANPLFWFVVDAFPASPPRIVSPNELVDLGFDGPVYLQIFIGRKDRAPGPLWRSAAERNELDFVASQAIQFVPSQARGNVLIEGRMGIMRLAEYERQGVLFEPLHKWFRELARDLEHSVNARELRLIVHSATDADAPSRRPVLISPGAMAWRRSGARLQQVAGSLIDFDLPIDPTPA